MSIKETKEKILALYTSGDPRGYVALAKSHDKLLEAIKPFMGDHVYEGSDMDCPECAALEQAIAEGEGE